jgi:hypothetical protein
VFPDCLKRAKITPLFKSGGWFALDNYRPILLLSVFSRIIEKVFCRRLSRLLEAQNFVHENRFGFRDYISTEQALLFLTKTINDSLDFNMKVTSLFLDIVKAFDCVNRKIFLRKFVNAGVCGKASRFIQSFLAGRMQCLSINGDTSGFLEGKNGVPQRSFLGPLFFINDLSNAIDGLDVKLPCGEIESETSVRKILAMFADDTQFTVAAKTESQLMSTLREVPSQIQIWLEANRLVINLGKSSVVV